MRVIVIAFDLEDPNHDIQSLEAELKEVVSRRGGRVTPSDTNGLMLMMEKGTEPKMPAHRFMLEDLVRNDNPILLSYSYEAE